METDRERGSPVGSRVAANVAALRDARRMSVRSLSARLSQLGRSLLPSGITKVEADDRRVDVDDLVALALALDVSPNRLLLAARADDTLLELTTDLSVPAHDAWRWATGETPLPGDDVYDVDRRQEFVAANRPHDPSVAEDVTMRELRHYRDDTPELAREANRLLDEGVPANVLLAVVRLASETSSLRRHYQQQEVDDG